MASKRESKLVEVKTTSGETELLTNKQLRNDEKDLGTRISFSPKTSSLLGNFFRRSVVLNYQQSFKNTIVNTIVRCLLNPPKRIMESKAVKGKAKVKLRFRYVDCEPLPDEVHGVMKDIQERMMDDITDKRSNQRNTVPNMPRDFFCSEVTTEVKEKMVELAGKIHENCSCYQIVLPFFMRPVSREDPQSRCFNWSGNVISFNEVSVNNDAQLAVVTVEGSLIPVKDPSTGERNLKVFPISKDMNELKSMALRTFLESPLVVNYSTGSRLVSSYKITISWLRSRVDKALNKYKEKEKDVEVIANNLQKEGGPVLLHVKVEKKLEASGELTKHDLLFIFCPAFRVSSCYLPIPIVCHFDEAFTKYIKEAKVKDEVKHCLWKIITKCSANDEKHKHKEPNITAKVTVEQLSKIHSQQKTKKPTGQDKTLYKESIAKPNPINPNQQEQCQRCSNPVSRMLLEYYYQYGYIPEEEMSFAESFVFDILQFFEKCIEEDREESDPRIIEFVKSGSVAEKLKVVKPDEFDVMIHIDLPKSTKCYTFKSHDAFPTGYVICQVKRSHTFSRGLKRCFRESDEFGYCLAPAQLAFSWLMGKLERSINKYKSDSPKALLKLRQSGPALLLEITPLSDDARLPRVISVDLVLALKLSEDDSRFAVAKQAREEHFYKKIIAEKQSGESSQGKSESTLIEAKMTSCETKLQTGSTDEIVPVEAAVEETEFARKNLRYLWRISYSAQEKQYLEYILEMQKENNVEGCQNVCLMILKTVCTREILKREESVLHRELSSYILKTALFHILAKSNLIQDWTMDCLADRYMDLLKKLSMWQELPHFFFNNASHLKGVFPGNKWSEETGSKNLLDELHSSLKLQLLARFSQIQQSFTMFKTEIDNQCATLTEKDDEQCVTSTNDWKILQSNLGGKTPEKVIHPPFMRARKWDRKCKTVLVDQQAVDSLVRKAAKTERKSGPHSSVDRNLQRPQEDTKKASKHQRNRKPKHERLTWSNIQQFF